MTKNFDENFLINTYSCHRPSLKTMFSSSSRPVQKRGKFSQTRLMKFLKLQWMESKLLKKWLDTCIFVWPKTSLFQNYSSSKLKIWNFQLSITFELRARTSRIQCQIEALLKAFWMYSLDLRFIFQYQLNSRNIKNRTNLHIFFIYYMKQYSHEKKIYKL
jgi:hypothetical protein